MSDAQINTIVKTILKKETDLSDNYGRVLKDRKELPIKLAWNKDDDKLPYSEAQEFIKVFEANENNYIFYHYETGGHEFNPEFIKLL